MNFFGKNEPRVHKHTIQIMMLGARRVGKTSMLASMYNTFSSVVQGTNLTMSKIGGTAIDHSLEYMKGLFKEDHFINDKVPGVSDFMQTQGFDEIEFTIKIAGKKTAVPKTIKFVDCSGEWINNRDNEEKIGEYIERSDVVIIAVDSVLLLENKGKYNEQNKCHVITEFIKNNMEPDSLVNDKKMILFVPTKCEKYFHQNENTKSDFYNKRMSELTSRLKSEYSELISYLTAPNNKKFFTVGILPVITLGGVEFDEFTSDEKEILTENIQYRYCDPDMYSPMYCDRPLIYTLLFVQKKISDDYYCKAYNNANNKKRLSHIIIEWFLDMQNIAKDPDYIIELNKVVDKLNTMKYPGYEIIQDPESIEMKIELNRKG